MNNNTELIDLGIAQYKVNKDLKSRFDRVCELADLTTPSSPEFASLQNIMNGLMAEVNETGTKVVSNWEKAATELLDIDGKVYLVTPNDYDLYTKKLYELERQIIGLKQAFIEDAKEIRTVKEYHELVKNKEV